MDTQIYVVIAGTFVGFVALAFGLLFPIYRFLTREEKAEQAWTADAIARRQARQTPSGPGSPGGDGHAAPPAVPPAASPGGAPAARP